jgi:hypothetical protein
VEYTLTLLDCTGIQDYIFGSNRLSENIGASELVAQATQEFVQEALQEATQENHNLSNLTQEQPLEANPDQRAEVIFQGGGNVAILFRSQDDAKATVCALSRLLLEQAPGLEIAAAHTTFHWYTDFLADHNQKPGVMRTLQEQLAIHKQHRPQSAPLLGLGVTLECRATGLPAHCFSTDLEKTEDSLPIHASVAAKLAYRSKSRTRLKVLFESHLLETYDIPERFDHMGRSHNELSYLAVVHIDGNDMGKRFQKVGKGKNNRDYITALRDLSEKVNCAGINALCTTIAAMEEMLRQQETSHGHDIKKQAYLNEVDNIVGNLKHNTDSKKPYLPFRPLVYGGDDVTFVCDGRLGLTLAIRYLQAFEDETEKLLGCKEYACAGVAIVKTHYPFIRAYQLAERLCQDAKRFVRKQTKDTENRASAIDWHFAASGRGDSIAAIRQREYTTQDNNQLHLLHLRPLFVSPQQNTHLRHWGVFEQAAWQFKYGEDWYERRNKVMALRETLRQGKDAVQHFLTRYSLKTLPKVSTQQSDASQKDGFHDEYCLYFDAIEALDIFLPLAPVEMEILNQDEKKESTP